VYHKLLPNTWNTNTQAKSEPLTRHCSFSHCRRLLSLSQGILPLLNPRHSQLRHRLELAQCGIPLLQLAVLSVGGIGLAAVVRGTWHRQGASKHVSLEGK
jgi:hypothetical protein